MPQTRCRRCRFDRLSARCRSPRGPRLRGRRELLERGGRAWLEFEVVPREGGATIRQTALFDPVGLFGRLYWYGVYPLHRLVFSRMLDEIARAATGRPPRLGEKRGS